MLKIGTIPTKKYSLLILIAFFVFSLCLGLYFRFHDIRNGALFAGDQGSDLLVAEDILNGNHRLLGPFLGIAQLFGPPTYYYLLAFFLLFTKDPVIVTIFFGILNLVTVLFTFLTHQLLFGKRIAVLITSLLLVFAYFVEQSRMIWQPWPAYLFLTISIYLLVVSIKNKNSILHFSSVLFFAISCSTYLTPILLAPWFLQNSFYFFSNTLKLRVSTVLQQIFLLYFLSFSFVYLPQIIYELNNNLPIQKALSSGSFGVESTGSTLLLTTLNENIKVFSSRVLKVKIHTFLLLLGVIVVVSQKYKKKITQLFSQDSIPLSVFKLWPILVSCAVVLSYKGSVHAHRLIFLLPIFLLYFSLTLKLAVQVNNLLLRGLLTAFFLYFYIGNVLFSLSHIPNHTTTKDFSTLSTVLLREIKSDTSQQNLRVELHLYTPSDVWNYELSPLLYYMKKSIAYPISFDKPGNDLLYRGDIKPADYYYLVCYGFQSERDREENCLHVFEKRAKERVKFNTSTVSTQEISANQYLYTLQPQK